MSQRPPKKKEAEFQNNPFKSAIKTLQDQEKQEKAAAAAAEASKKKAVAQKPTKAPKARPEDDDVGLFFSAMDGVQQITHRGEAPKTNPRLPELIDDNAEALAQLSDLVAVDGPLSFTGSDTAFEGASPGTDPNLLRSLRRGDFSVQDRLDLHGKTQREAQAAVERFLSDSRRAKRRCVLIVHGRGLNSKDQIPVLKDAVRDLLSQKRLERMVLAFSTARPQDGGAGAVYVLLRR
ncbi:DNA mismatch repair protein MutS [Corallococcus exiguus]|uniref:Smr/MutS family protein n=1 Tax=Corallococcus exiguus TaxID=83462 RepID=UPI0014720C32|nr:Smr/MutS family protein [Corallococcus exiguus]NNC15370.1 DNA mismatch repair protein MutS [Corallococcus exiguus]